MISMNLFYCSEKVWMDVWKKFNVTSLPVKEKCYNILI